MLGARSTRERRTRRFDDKSEEEEEPGDYLCDEKHAVRPQDLFASVVHEI